MSIQRMEKVKLLARLQMSGIVYAAGVVLPVPARTAAQLVRLGVAELVEPERAVVSQPETR